MLILARGWAQNTQIILLRLNLEARGPVSQKMHKFLANMPYVLKPSKVH